ncbi:nucelotide kinase [Enterococcus phage BUCT630]
MFKVGDKVRCIDNDGTPTLTIGEVYEIIGSKYDDFTKETFVCLKNNTSEYVASRFEKVTDSDESEELENTKRYKTTSGKQLFGVLEDDLLTYEEVRGFYKANIYKYTHRYKQKNGVEDLKKVKVYVDQLIKLEEKHNEI